VWDEFAHSNLLRHSGLFKSLKTHCTEFPQTNIIGFYRSIREFHCILWSGTLEGSSKYRIMRHCTSSCQQQQCCIGRYKWQYLVHTIFWEVESRCSVLHWVALSSWERTICFFSTGLGKHHYRNTKWSILTRCSGTRLEPVNIAVYPRGKCFCSGVAL